jgi:osmoprotectant transport system substrate-binding protein
MKQKILLGVAVLCLILGGMGGIKPAKACAGYTLMVGSTGTLRQELLTQILSLLISQRTGTNIQMVRYKSQSDLLAAASRHEVDLLVTDAGPSGATDRQRFLSKQGLMLLEPFGCRNAQIAPVFQAATLKRFPALKRLVSRLGGMIDDETMERLEADVISENNLRDVVKKFLAEQKLIFGG